MLFKLIFLIISYSQSGIIRMSYHHLTGIKDLDIQILSKLDISDLMNACMTNKNIAKLCGNPVLWKIKFQRDFNSTSVPDTTENWKQLYQKFYIRKDLINQIITFMTTSYTEQMFIDNRDNREGDTILESAFSYSKLIYEACERLERESISFLRQIDSLCRLIKLGRVGIMDKENLIMEKASIIWISGGKFCVMSSTLEDEEPLQLSPYHWSDKPDPYKENKIKTLLDFITSTYDEYDVERDLRVEGPVHGLELEDIEQFREYQRSQLISLPIEILDILHHIRLLIISKYISIDPLYIASGWICSGFLLVHGNLILFHER